MAGTIKRLKELDKIILKCLSDDPQEAQTTHQLFLKVREDIDVSFPTLQRYLDRMNLKKIDISTKKQVRKLWFKPISQ